MPTTIVDPVVIDASTIVPVGAPPEIVEEIPIARRPRMERSDFVWFGYTGGCPGCVHLQAGSPGSRNHNETCRSRTEKHLEDTADGRERKNRALQRSEDQLTRELERQDELVTTNDASVAVATSIAPEGQLGLTTNIDEDLVLQPGLRREREASNLPDVDTLTNDGFEFESGPVSKTEAVIPIAHRAPA